MRGRKPKASERRGKLVGMTNIKERPEEIEGRLVPGHWEGDLILGTGGASAIGTLVERTTRFVVLVHMPTRKADVAACAFAGALNAIPEPLRKTLTYDQPMMRSSWPPRSTRSTNRRSPRGCNASAIPVVPAAFSSCWMLSANTSRP